MWFCVETTQSTFEKIVFIRVHSWLRIKAGVFAVPADTGRTLLPNSHKKAHKTQKQVFQWLLPPFTGTEWTVWTAWTLWWEAVTGNR